MIPYIENANSTQAAHLNNCKVLEVARNLNGFQSTHAYLATTRDTHKRPAASDQQM